MIADIFRLIFTILFISVYQFNSVAQLCPTLCDSMDCSMPGLPVHHQLPELKLMSIELVMPSNHLILCHPLLLPSIFPASGSFQMSQFFVSGVQKYWRFSISPSSEYSGVISFRMDWLDLLAVQGTLGVFSNTTLQKHQLFSAQLSL